MADRLQCQVREYGNYYYTGIEFLDVIIRDKAKRAQEGRIDFHAAISFGDGRFLGETDIGNIWGNALDNAIEASIKLPEDERLVTVRAKRVWDMLVIRVENRFLPDLKPSGIAMEKERFCHSFRLLDIRKAVERYGGECCVKMREGMFVLKILIPVP